MEEHNVDWNDANAVAAALVEHGDGYVALLLSRENLREIVKLRSGHRKLVFSCAVLSTSLLSLVLTLFIILAIS